MQLAAHNFFTHKPFVTFKCKVCLAHEECRRHAHLPFLGREPVGRYTTEVCDAWPVRSQTYGYLPSRRASPPLYRYQKHCLVTEEHVCEQLAQCCHLKEQCRDLKPRLSESQVQRLNYCATKRHMSEEHNIT